MPAPLSLEPLAIVRFSRVKWTPPETWNPPPLMASEDTPGPMMVRSLSTTNLPLARVTVPVPPNTMESPGAESAMSRRSEPAPLSASEVTLFVAEWARSAKASTSTTVIVESELTGGINLRVLGFSFAFIENSFLSFVV
jgi:hypothetical protein